MLNGTTDLAMSMTSAAQMALEGSALAVEDEACDGEGYYAIISKVLMTGNWYDGLVALYVENENELVEGDELVVYGKFAGAVIKLDEDKYTVTPTLTAGKVAKGQTYTITVAAGAKNITKSVVIPDGE